ncbi:unnamed protein product [Rotaria magnacalcarata]|uniref:Mitochondrial import receptor subunit TOM70 n=2 Tax=Rotaria magnacalcarata TaxID=392030 RepID=A0A816U1R9_9BILA|nr:unnamed protein product [Rotaria magnacalcarata]CAF3841492.1 unnamed protein product [Rotaria magnacalcarata]
MASYLRTVAKSSSSSTSADGPANSLGKRLVKWGLIIGVPTAVCVAAYLVYRQQQEQAKKSAARRSPLPTPMASVNEDTASGLENRTKSRLTVAIELKNEGNLKYRDQKFHEAIEAYTRAIEICPMESTEELSQFYQNRAAAWESLKDYARVIEDCSKAIELNQKYVKCIQRRARAAETIGNFELALEDYSTVCFIDSYQPAYIMAADKVLTDLAKRYMETLPPSTAELSKDFVRTSLNEFEDDPILNQSFIDELKRAQPDSSLARAYQAFDEDRYTDIPSLCTNELESTTDSPYKLETLLLRGSFYLLMGSYAEALADFDTIINDPEATEKIRLNTELKRANCKIHQRDIEGALHFYDQCVAYHPNECSPRVHRGMLKTLLENFTEAHDDFIEALRISPTNLRAKYQKLINDAKIGAKEHRNDRVERALSSFEEYYDTSKQDIYYALAITSCFLDNDRKDKALAYLDKFITHIPSNPTLLALKANCLMSNDPSNNTEAERLYIQALDIDPSNETVLTMFAIFKCNQNQFEEAAALYERAIHCTRGEEKLMQYAALLYAIRAQGRAIKRLNLNFPGGFPQGGALPNWMGGMP